MQMGYGSVGGSHKISFCIYYNNILSPVLPVVRKKASSKRSVSCGRGERRDGGGRPSISMRRPPVSSLRSYIPCNFIILYSRRLSSGQWVHYKVSQLSALSRVSYTEPKFATTAKYLHKKDRKQSGRAWSGAFYRRRADAPGVGGVSTRVLSGQNS